MSRGSTTASAGAARSSACGNACLRTCGEAVTCSVVGRLGSGLSLPTADWQARPPIMAYTTALPHQPIRPAHASAVWHLVARPVTCGSCSGAGERQQARLSTAAQLQDRRAQAPVFACLLRPVELELQLVCFGPGAFCGACCAGAGMAGRRLRLLLSCGDAQSFGLDGAARGHCLCCCWRRRKADMVLRARFTACMHTWNAL